MRRDTIKVEQGHVLILEFTAFNLQSDSTCRWDYLTIADGDGTALMNKTCGSDLPSKINSRSNLVDILFTTNHAVEKTGWSVSWSAAIPGVHDFLIFNFNLPKKL